jgi:hypothetical protein
VRAFEAADITGLVQLVTDDAVLEMPPVPWWYRGSQDYGLFMARVFEMRDDLAEKARLSETESLDEIKWAVLETNGDISFIRQSGS